MEQTPSPPSRVSLQHTPPSPRQLCFQTEYIRHPCPIQRHHPGERCGCAQRLKVNVPHGYCRKSDLGFLHAARLQNLRWRLTRLADHSDTEPKSPSELRLPPSLSSLAEDHQGGAGTKSIRPLEREQAQPSVKRSATGSGTATDGVRRPLHVSFSKQLVSEVPVIDGSLNKELVKLPPRKSQLGKANKREATEDRARRNMQNLWQNHRWISEHVRSCFSFVPCWKSPMNCHWHALSRRHTPDFSGAPETSTSEERC